MTVENILKMYRLATPEEKRDGVVWYAEAYAQCNRIAIDLEVPVHIVTGVVAALSPNNKWDRNVSNAHDLIGAFTNGDDIDDVKVSTYHTMKRKAWSILEAMSDHEGVIAILNGQKLFHSIGILWAMIPAQWMVTLKIYTMANVIVSLMTRQTWGKKNIRLYQMLT